MTTGEPGSGRTTVVERERQRLLAESRRRLRQVPGDLYSPWNRTEQFMRHGRRRLAASLLHSGGLFPGPDARCLEIGFGTGGWLTDLLSWGVAEAHLHGVEIDLGRLGSVARRLPSTRLVRADGAALPYPDAYFDLVVVSTVFTSILDQEVRRLVADEIRRVTAAAGALLWYDFAVDNPRNPGVRRVSRGELADLFPGWRAEVRRVTLAPPLARRIVPRSWWLAELLETLPFLRTHLLAVLVPE